VHVFVQSSLLVQPFQSSNLMRSINGMMYGNLPGLIAAPNADDKRPVVLYFMSINRDAHALHLSGQAITVRGQRSVT
jgi:hypothetical protein